MFNFILNLIEMCWIVALTRAFQPTNKLTKALIFVKINSDFSGNQRLKTHQPRRTYRTKHTHVIHAHTVTHKPEKKKKTIQQDKRRFSLKGHSSQIFHC